MKKGAEDWELWYRLLRNGYIFITSSNYGALYRQKNDSMIKQFPFDHVRESMQLLEKSYAPIAEKDRCAGESVPFTEPLSRYQLDIQKMSRIVFFMAIARMNGNTKDLERLKYILKDMPRGSACMHVDVAHWVTLGTKRYLSSSTKRINNAAISHRKSTLCSEIQEIFAEKSGFPALKL